MELDYNNLDEETKIFVNKAIDIYATIRDSEIIRTVREFASPSKDYRFKRFDKKVMALFIAWVMVEGNSKNLLAEYDDIKLEDLLAFTKISENEITKLAEDEYSNFYNENLLSDMEMIMETTTSYKVNSITPEVIVYYLSSPFLETSEILSYFAVNYRLNRIGLWQHPLRKALEKFCLRNDTISKNTPCEKFAKRDPAYPLFGFPDYPKTEFPKKEKPLDLKDEKVWLLLDEIQKKFIGQEEAAEGLFYNIINNQQLAELKDLPDGQRSIIFLDGPTGTGKTAITREIAENLGVPFASSSITNYSSTGYYGGDITDTLKELLKKADGNVEKAQKGIIVFDEFDKIAFSQQGGLEMKRAVQQQLLDFLGGGRYLVSSSNSMYNENEVEFDTSKLTFVCIGALTELRNQKMESKQAIGFGINDSPEEKKDYTITPHDLIGIGLERELVGRFNTYLHTKDYSKDDLSRILKESTISPLLGFKQWVEANGKELVYDEDVFEAVAEQAYWLNTGARSLQTVMNSIRTPFIKEVLRGNNDTIYFDAATAKKISGQTITRKGRM